MDAVDLHYSRAKLVRLGFLSLLMSAAGAWVANAGIHDSHGRRARALLHLLGPTGLQALGWTVAAVALVLAFLYLRRAFGNPVAARAEAGGVTFYTLFGTHHYAAADIERLALEQPMGQPVLQLTPLPGRGRKRGLAANGLAEDADEIEAWIEAAQARLREAGAGWREGR